eukprot:gene46008-58973_t
MMVLSMLIFGGPTLHFFAVALTIGILFGIYSSVFVAAAIAMWLGVKREDLIKPVKPKDETDGAVVLFLRKQPVVHCWLHKKNMSIENNNNIDFDRRFGGIARLYGAAGLARFRQAHVCVVGVGGVGSWVVEALARSAIGKITMIDLDNLAESNINRQIH